MPISNEDKLRIAKNLKKQSFKHQLTLKGMGKRTSYCYGLKEKFFLDKVETMSEKELEAFQLVLRMEDKIKKQLTIIEALTVSIAIHNFNLLEPISNK